MRKAQLTRYYPLHLYIINYLLSSNYHYVQKDLMRNKLHWDVLYYGLALYPFFARNFQAKKTSHIDND